MPIRNPFRNREAGGPVPGALSREHSSSMRSESLASSSRKSSSLNVNEYQLSEINDSGIYLPPSPSETKNSSFWSSTRSKDSFQSSRTSNHRSMLSENEPFNMSRESFDSYRRSFDISARSPVPSAGAGDFPTRASLDSRRLPTQRASQLAKSNGLARFSNNTTPQNSTATNPPPSDAVTENKEDEFEDVGLDDPKPAKKRGVFARFAGESAATRPESPTNNAERPSSSGRSFHFGLGSAGRKRGDSGRGAELGNLKGIQKMSAVAMGSQAPAQEATATTEVTS